MVVGAGVVGLSCAVRLLEAGHRVDVVARDLPLETTSAVAAALWYPYRAWPRERVTAWSARGLAVLEDLAAQGVPGVVVRRGTEVHHSEQPDPWWIGAAPALERTRDVPAPYVAGWRLSVPVVEMGPYLRWLTGRIGELGGTLTRLALGDLPSPPGEDGWVVNCSGLGSRRLAADDSLHPVRGEVLRLAQWGLQEWWLDGGAESAGTSPTYVVPREHDVVVGGTAVEGEWSRTPSEETATALLERAARLVPELATARVLGHRVGLRPGRSAVRLEAQDRVVHCYGHGGAGVTLSWGCAEDVVGLVGPAD